MSGTQHICNDKDNIKMLNMILAMNKDNLIGINNDLPWHLSEDLKRFKQLTQGKTVIMGKNTYLSMVPYFIDKEILPGRHKVILTSANVTAQENITIVKSIADIQELIKDTTKEFWLIGGAQLFRQLYNQVDNIYLTRVNIDTPTLKEQYYRSKNTLFNQERHNHGFNEYHIVDIDLANFTLTESTESKNKKCTFLVYKNNKNT